MKKRLLAILLTFCLLLSACASSAEPDPTPADPEQETTQPEAQEPATPEESPEPELTQREKDWRADLKYLQDEYKKYHKDPFRYCAEDEFDWKFEQLAGRINELSDTDIFFEMAAIIAGMGDTHTAVMPMFFDTEYPIYDTTFPVLIQYYGDRLYLLGYREGYEQLAPYLLQEIVAVNGIDISYLEKKAESICNPFNSWNSKESFASHYFFPAFFDWAGCDYTEGYTFQILNENHEVESVEVPAVPLEDALQRPPVIADAWKAMPSSQGGNWAKYFEGEDGDYVFMSLVDLSVAPTVSHQALLEEAAGLLQAHPDCGTLVIDLRWNPGGSEIACDRIREHIHLLKDAPLVRTYVLTGGYTASAAMFCLSMFKDELNAVSVGEPTGQFTSCYSVVSVPRALPNSQIAFRISHSWHEGPEIATPYYDETGHLYEWENTILPDVYVSQDIDDIRLGKDSVIQWILAQ